MSNKHGGKKTLALIDMKQRCNNSNYEIAKCFEKHGDEDDFIVCYDIILWYYLHNTGPKTNENQQVAWFHELIHAQTTSFLFILWLTTTCGLMHKAKTLTQSSSFQFSTHPQFL